MFLFNSKLRQRFVNKRRDIKMNNQEILKHIDHTQLKPFAKWEDIEKLCEEAIKYQTASVCIPPA